MRKYLSLIIAGVAILGFGQMANALVTSTTTATTTATYTPQEGELIKLKNHPAIYYVGENKKRFLFPNEDTFWTWRQGRNWTEQQVQTIEQEVFDQLQSGERIRVRPGVRLIQFENASGTIYSVTPGNKLCKIFNSQAAEKLFGQGWQQRLITIQPGFESDYTNDVNCRVKVDSFYPDGTLLRFASSSVVWQIEDGKRVQVSQEVLDSEEFDESDIIVLSHPQWLMVEKMSSTTSSSAAFQYDIISMEKWRQRSQHIKERVTELFKKYRERAQEMFQREETNDDVAGTENESEDED